MVDDGLVTESTPKDDASGGPARRYYQYTRLGRAVARAESERLQALLDVARAQNMFGGPTSRVCISSRCAPFPAAPVISIPRTREHARPARQRRLATRD
jgi:hypothetical protein